jgi:hypothetical protein
MKTCAKSTHETGLQPTIFVGFGQRGEEILSALKERLTKESDEAVPPPIFDFLLLPSPLLGGAGGG